MAEAHSVRLVRSFDEGSQVYIFETEEDGSLLVERLAVFPGAHSLQYRRADTGEILSIHKDATGTFFPRPLFGWLDRSYVVVCNQPEAVQIRGNNGGAGFDEAAARRLLEEFRRDLTNKIEIENLKLRVLVFFTNSELKRSLTNVENKLLGVETKLDKVENNLRSVETKLDKVEEIAIAAKRIQLVASLVVVLIILHKLWDYLYYEAKSYFSSLFKTCTNLFYSFINFFKRAD